MQQQQRSELATTARRADGDKGKEEEDQGKLGRAYFAIAFLRTLYIRVRSNCELRYAYVLTSESPLPHSCHRSLTKL